MSGGHEYEPWPYDPLAACRRCDDGGVVDEGGYCACPAGAREREIDEEDAEYRSLFDRIDSDAETAAVTA